MVGVPDFSEQSRVWIYTANRRLSEAERDNMNALLKSFAQRWVSHNRSLKAHAQVIEDLFVLLMVDESQAGASGCSIDASVHFLKEMQEQFDIDLFDRMNFSFVSDGGFQLAGRNDFLRLYQSGEIDDKTIVANTLVKTKGELDAKFLIPLGESWHRRMV
ncbi:MAG: hypothetical protein KJP00_16865 [Bacteroidia bacterium]|nr:hypothetical protein [Bacteroidia bacterium]